MPPTDARTSNGRKGLGWPIAVAAILGLTIALNLWVARLAGSDPSFAIEPDYYQKALHWDDEMAQQRRNAALGWRLEPALAPLDRAGARLTVRLTDRAGAPLPDATLTVEALAVARAAHTVRATLAPDAGGYRAVLPLHTDGEWELRFEARRGDDRFTAVRRLLAAPAVLGARHRAGAPGA